MILEIVLFFAQTTLHREQTRAPQVPSALYGIVNNKWTIVQLDSSLTITVVGGVATLKANPPATQWQVDTYVVSAGLEKSFILTKTVVGKPRVHRNGIRLIENRDYTFVGSTVTLTGEPVSVSDDILVEYQF